MKKRKKKLVNYEWLAVGNNLYFYKDKDGVVWQLLRTPYKEIPIAKMEGI